MPISQTTITGSVKTPDNSEALTRLEEEVRLLHIRNRDLRQSYEYRWFAAGGLLALLAAARVPCGARGARGP